jgi:DNA anti-recombination protein RmuC
MNQQGKSYFLYFFVCNNCQGEFHHTTAYSPSPTNLGETYCIDCANRKYFSSSLKSQSNNNTSSLSSNSYSTNKINSSPNSNQVFNQEKTSNLNNQNQTQQKTLKEVNQKLNLRPSELTSQDKRFTGRTKQLNLKVKEQTYWRLKELALKNKCLMTEMFEKVLEGYGKSYKIR